MRSKIFPFLMILFVAAAVNFIGSNALAEDILNSSTFEEPASQNDPPQTSGINWEGDFDQFRYSVSKNGGVFQYAPEMYFRPNSQATEEYFYNPANSLTPPYDAVASGNLVEFGAPPGEIRMNALAQGPDGGINPPNGLLVQAYAEVIPADLDPDHGVDVEQEVVSWINRRFTVDSDGPYRLGAYLDGVLDFDAFFNSDTHQAAYSVSGEINLEQSVLDGGQEVITQVPGFPVSLDDAMRSSQVTVDLSVKDAQQRDITYKLKVQLTLNSRIINFNVQGTVADVLTGTYQLGKGAVAPDTPMQPMQLRVSLMDASLADTDGDGVADDFDNCPNVSNWDQADSDGDGVGDVCDNCPQDPGKTDPGICGCGVADTDTDGDGTPDCNDDCPDDTGKTEPGICGCGVADTDTDGDGTPDCNDSCPNDPHKIEPGVCGCGVADTDTDGDGTPDCNDNCPDDPGKTDPGTCGCGISDVDSDSDGTPNCSDSCPNDPHKIEPGVCGCGSTDADSDGDEVLDCLDAFPSNPNEWLDTDADGIGDNEDPDDDNDKMPDDWEKQYGLDPLINDASEDFDGDGRTNLLEFKNGTDPTDPDSFPVIKLPWVPLLLD